jgi:hypothetical protein
METKTISSVGNLVKMLGSCLFAAVMIKLPAIFPNLIDESDFYLKLTSFVVFTGIGLYLLVSSGLDKKQSYLWAALVYILPLLVVLFLPKVGEKTYTIHLVILHAALLLWCLLGMIFIGWDRSVGKRMDYIRYNGDLVVLSSLFFLASGLFTAITFGLFGAMGFHIEEFYMQNIALMGAVCIPIVATWVIKNHGMITNKLAPLIANIFSPIVLGMLLIFLISLPFSDKDPFNDRNFLITFNALLLGVMALIVFTVSETSRNKKQQFNKVVLSLLSIAALIIDVVALAAIVFRLSEYGFTPNRTAALGANILLFVHLSWIAVTLIRTTLRREDIGQVETTVARYLPVYTLWTLFVIVGFPLIFGVK